MTRGLVLAALVSVFVYAVLAFLTDGGAILSVLRGFPVSTFAAMLALSAAGFGIRALRWRLLMRRVAHDAGIADALYLQLSGQTMTLTPGRLGEVFKGWLARRVTGMPTPVGVALVLSERVADAVALGVLALGGVSLLRAGEIWIVPTLLVATVLAVWAATSERLHRAAIRAAFRREGADARRSSLESVSHTIRVALGWGTLPWSAGMAVLAWGLEGIGLVLCVRELGFSGLGAFGAVSLYAVSTLAGALSLLPGGVGLTEASMAGLLVALGMDAPAASGATLIVRGATLWWGVALGWLSLATRPALLKEALVWTSSEERADA